MNKKILSLLFLLILLVSVTISYAIFFQPSQENTYKADSESDVDQDTFSSEVDSTFLDEDQEIEIGDMI